MTLGIYDLNWWVRLCCSSAARLCKWYNIIDSAHKVKYSEIVAENQLSSIFKSMNFNRTLKEQIFLILQNVLKIQGSLVLCILFCLQF